ncbi:MAG: hypothetical protein JWO31_981, partial [Phycisphaerales bacterium]|nr:hypothetical protein [Phycisphaerales bacterium]
MSEHPRATLQDPRQDRQPAAVRRRWASGWVVLVTVLLLGMIGAVAYARVAAAEVAFRLITEGGLVIAWLAAAAGWGAWQTDWLLGRRSDRGVAGHALLGTTAVALGLGVLGLLALGLGLAGLLNQASAVALLVCGGGLGVTWAYRARHRWGGRTATAAGPPGSP